MRIHPIYAKCKFGCKKSATSKEPEVCVYFEEIDWMDEYRAKRWKRIV